MKHYLLILLSIFSSSFLFSQINSQNDGVFKTIINGKTNLLISIDNYVVITKYEKDSFVSTYGGTAIWDENQLEINIEFNSEDSESVGNSEIYGFIRGEDLKDVENNIWKKVETNDQGLDGIWQISARKIDAELKTIRHSGTRKTIKILKDSYFQWIAIDPGKKEFYGTGGGKYSFKKGKYKEQIYFFSRDNSRVGARLEFDGELVKGKWHHSGFSSKGEPIYEIWKKVKN